MVDLPKLRSGERADFKRCVKKWFWRWRMGLVPRQKRFGALDLGTWMHAGLAAWYGTGRRRNGKLSRHVDDAAAQAIREAKAQGAPEHVLDKAYELAALGEAMAAAYEIQYGRDTEIDVIAAELPLEFVIADPENDEPIAVHKLKPDLVFRDADRGVWLMEHKTAGAIRTEHLVIDDQARPYGVFTERALQNLGIISRTAGQFKGILYNFMRKALPDLREVDANGKYLNKNGSVSKRQPARQFLRFPVRLTREAKRRTLYRILGEAVVITEVTRALRLKKVDPRDLPITPHHSCPKFCDYFAICTAEEEGTDIRSMVKNMFIRQDPYIYDEESTDEIATFEMG